MTPVSCTRRHSNFKSIPIRPKTTPLSSDAPVLVAEYVSVDVDELDLTEGTWMTHPAKEAEPLPGRSRTSRETPSSALTAYDPKAVQHLPRLQSP